MYLYAWCYFLNTGMVTCSVLFDGTMLLAAAFQFWVVFVKKEYSSQSCFLSYIDDLITDLKLSGYGANIGNIFAGSLL